MPEGSTHRLVGLEPDNLLAFLALLGMLRTLEQVRAEWHPRVAWAVDRPPARPTLAVAAQATDDEVISAVSEGLANLADRHSFNGLKKLELSREEAAHRLRTALTGDRYTSDLWSALVSDAAIRYKNKAEEAEPTPLCLMSGQGWQFFMSRLASVPQQSVPPARGSGRSKATISETDCLREALFKPWTRPDATFAFRWDPHEDVRYALRAADPTDSKTKETTQHGANRLAAIGLSAVTVVPRLRGKTAQLAVVGGGREPGGGFAFTWPIWRHPISLAAIRSLLGHTGLDRRDTWDALGIVELRRARRISVGKFMNFTRAEPIHEPEAKAWAPRGRCLATGGGLETR